MGAVPEVGEVLRGTVTHSFAWGVTIDLEGNPDVSASIDMGPLDLLSSDRSGHPEPGEVVEAVVINRHLLDGRWRIRLSHRPEDVGATWYRDPPEI